MDLSNLTNDELASGAQAHIVEIEKRFAAHGGFPRAHKRVKTAHACLDDAMQDVVGGGLVQPFSGGTPKD